MATGGVDEAPVDSVTSPAVQTVIPSLAIIKSSENADVSKYCCAHCQNILQEPRQSPCGYRYCAACIEALEDRAFPCCIDEGCDSDERCEASKCYPDPATGRELRKLRCRCLKTSCPWTGSYPEYARHISTCDSDEIMPCPQCQEEMCKGEIQGHIDKVRGFCRMNSCPFGCDNKNTLEHRLQYDEDHSRLTLQKSLETEKKVEKVARKADVIHGVCNTNRGDLNELRGRLDSMPQETQAVIRPILEDRQRLANDNEQIRAIVQRLEDRVCALEQQLNNRFNIASICNAINHAGTGQVVYESEPFYTAPRGYRAQFKLIKASATHLGAEVRILRGENDQVSDWPFSRNIFIFIWDVCNRDQPRHKIRQLTVSDARSVQKPSSADDNTPIKCDNLIRLSKLLDSQSTFVDNGDMTVEVMTF